ncbi:MAG: hypothetical protein H6624_01630 [Bdellovibrionaceae bacterium]|nr:hypothetical protein [Bdellovibrionales bacterium]MCB9083008.1 hypothetical protein [Pseudobdellovibrionaceae bacterium]
MKPSMRVFAIFFLVATLFPTPSFAGRKSGLHMFVGTANQLTFPGTIRVGWYEWEAGMFHPTTYGMAKIFFFSPSLYTSLGFAATTQGALDLGLMGSIGFDYDLFWGLGLRAELFAVHSFNGFSTGVGILGLSYDF